MRLGPTLATLTILAASPLGACRCQRAPETVEPEPARVEAGERVRVPGVAVSLLVPDAWKHEIEEGVISLIGPGERVVLTVMVVEAADLEESLTILDKELRQLVRGAKLHELSERDVGGMRALIGGGEGSLDGEKVDLEVMLVGAPESRRIVILFGVALPGSDAAAVDAILGSLRPIGE